MKNDTNSLCCFECAHPIRSHRDGCVLCECSMKDTDYFVDEARRNQLVKELQNDIKKMKDNMLQLQHKIKEVKGLLDNPKRLDAYMASLSTGPIQGA